ncbi:MAG: rhodanese-like domain-containing protein [Planctomycetota bacterium]
MSRATITPASTMGEILQQYPSAQRALFQRYHIGGCSACAFQETDTLGQVCKDHNLLDVGEVVRHIELSQEADETMRIDVATVRGWLAAGEPLQFVDVRMDPERAEQPVPEAEPLDRAQSGKYMELPKDTRLVFLCANGDSSLDVAAYFAGHGFTEVRALAGGVEAWTA